MTYSLWNEADNETVSGHFHAYILRESDRPLPSKEELSSFKHTQAVIFAADKNESFQWEEQSGQKN